MYGLIMTACKQYCARILISDNTYKKLRGTYYAREIDRVVVKGKTEPVGVYEILDYHTEETFTVVSTSSRPARVLNVIAPCLSVRYIRHPLA